MFFKQVAGQQAIKDTVLQLIREGHLPHAINLIGGEGSGNLALALAMAQYIVCKNKGSDDSCGTCAPCIKMSKLQHPDVHFSFPVIKTGNSIPTSKDFIKEFRELILQNPYATDSEWFESLGKEKQGNITALECREIIQKLQLRSFESEYKVLIMWYPEYLGTAGNILLKLIEEPSPKTILIFVTVSPDKLLLTIQSRTQIFALKRLSDSEISDALVQRGFDATQATQCARIAEGNYNEALKIAAHHESALFDILRNWLNSLYSNNGLQLVHWVNEMAEHKKDFQKKFLEYFMQLLEHSIRLSLVGPKHLALLENELKLIQTLLQKGLDESRVVHITETLNDAIYHIERNANSKILFHNVSLRIQKMVLKKNTGNKV